MPDRETRIRRPILAAFLSMILATGLIASPASLPTSEDPDDQAPAQQSADDQSLIPPIDRTAARQILDRYADRNLEQLSEKEMNRIQAAFDCFLGTPPPPIPAKTVIFVYKKTEEGGTSELVPEEIDYTPLRHKWCPVWITELKASSQPGPRLLLFERFWLRIIPGPLPLRISILDKDGRLLSQTTMDAGWRAHFIGVEIPKKGMAGRPLIVIRTRPGSAIDIHREFLTLDHDHPVLLRLENSHLQPVRNHYNLSGSIIGPPPERISYLSWKSMLESDNQIDQLRALLWFTGVHWTADPSEAAREAPENYNEEDLFLLQIPESVKSLQERLTHSENLWIRQSATLALSQKGGKKER